MGKVKPFKNTLSILAMLASIIGAFVAIISTFFPNVITSATKQAIEFDTRYIKPGGDVRSTVVAAQADVFFIASALIIVLAGFAMANYYYSGTRINASSVAVGGGNTSWPFIFTFSSIAIVFILLGINFPRAIFDPTNENVLRTHLNLIAWAKNSWLGGCMLGIIGYGIAFIVATGVFTLVIVVPRSIRRSSILKTLRAI